MSRTDVGSEHSGILGTVVFRRQWCPGERSVQERECSGHSGILQTVAQETGVQHRVVLQKTVVLRRHCCFGRP